MTDRDRLIKSLDGADLFLRNRATPTDAPLNEYDMEIMRDIAKTCDEAARALEKAIIPPYEIGTKVCVITSQTSDNRNFYIFEDIISQYHICRYSAIMGLENHMGIPKHNWDKVFLTKEEAEKALKEREGNEIS